LVGSRPVAPRSSPGIRGAWGRVAAALAEARQEAGDDPVDPKLLLALTEALAATFDPGYH
jgi:hypothetical protein